MPDLVCSELEQDRSNSRQGCHGHGQLPDRASAESKKIKARHNYCCYGQLPDFFNSQLEQSSSNSRLCFHGFGQWPRRKIARVGTITVVMASSLILFVASWNRIAVILDNVFMVIPSCLTLACQGEKKIPLDRITVVMACLLYTSDAADE